MTTEYTGRGDPARSMALLWRTPDRPNQGRGRGRRPGLSVDLIVRAAIELADADGLAALSMRRVAQRLGVGTMSLYTYVPAKAELLDVMLDTVYGEVTTDADAEADTGADTGADTDSRTAAGPDDGNAGWRAALERVARANWALYHRHPWLLQVAATSRPLLGPNAIAKYDHELRAVAGTALTEIEMDSVVTLVTGYVHGAVRGSVDAAQAEKLTGLTDEQWWRAYAPFLNQALDPDRYPVAAKVGTAVGETFGGPYDAEFAFEFGLQRVLDGIEALVRAREESPGG